MNASRTGSLAVRLGAAAIGILVLAGPVHSQESDFFEEKDTYFQTETTSGVSKRAESLLDTPATVTVIDREDIERYGFHTIADVLNFASVGSFTHNDRRYDFVGGRGLFFFEDYNTRILVMLNGHPLNEPWNNFGGVGREMAVPLELAERIEIVYGPSSLLYGGYSLYGIVNVITQNGASAPGARARVSGGSWDTFETLASYGASGTAGTSSWDVLLAGGYYRSSGEDLNLPSIEVDYTATHEGTNVWGGPQSGTDFERSPFGFLSTRRGDLSLLLRTGYRRHGAPLAPYEAVYGSPEQSVKDAKHFGEIRWDHRLSRTVDLSARAFYDDYTFDEHDPYEDAETYPGAERYDFLQHAHDRDGGAEVRLHYQGLAHSLTLGGEYRWRAMSQRFFDRLPDGSIAPESLQEERVSGHLAVAYLQEEWRPVDKLAFVVGACLADTQPGGSRAQPRAGIVFRPRPTIGIKVLYNEGFRPPSIYEAEYADYAGQIDNPALRSERIRAGELSLVWNANPRLSVQGYAFASKLMGLIRDEEIEDPSEVQGGVTSRSGDPADLVGQFQYQSRADVRSWGAGVSLRARGPRRLRAHLNLAYAWARAREGAESVLPGSPSWLGSGGVSYDAARWTAGFAARYVGSQPLDPSHGNGEAGDFLEANLRLSFKTRLVYPLRFDLDLRNIFDTRGSLAAGPIYTPPTVPIEGRRLLLSAEVRF